jgi:hypothetical protein
MKICEMFIELFYKVVSKSKMDWCDIRFDKNNKLYIYDLDNRCKMSFKLAVSEVYDGVCDLQSLGFSEMEETQFYNCCKCIIGR